MSITRFCVLLMITVAALSIEGLGQEDSGTKKAGFRVIRSPVQRAYNPEFRGKPEQEIESVEHQLSDALRMKDWPLLDKLLSADVLLAGVVAEKPVFIALLKQFDTKYASIEKSEMRIRIHGDVAVVTGIQRADIDIENGSRMSQTIFLNTWKRIDGLWRCVAMSS